MALIASDQSELTNRNQTTLPSAVRRHLNLGIGDRINFLIEDDGRVYLEAAQESEMDPALGRFLDILAADIEANPKRLQPLEIAAINRIQALVGDEPVDLDSPLPEEGG